MKKIIKLIMAIIVVILATRFLIWRAECDQIQSELYTKFVEHQRAYGLSTTKADYENYMQELNK